jgi:hypothetical protein
MFCQEWLVSISETITPAISNHSESEKKYRLENNKNPFLNINKKIILKLAL